MVALNGTDAQVAAATEIRAKLYAEWTAQTERGLAAFEASMAEVLGDDEDPEALAYAATERADLLAGYAATEERIFGHVEAGWWLNTAGRSRLAELITAR